MANKKNGSRHGSRLYAMQALYQSQFSPGDASAVLADFYENMDVPIKARDYLNKLVTEVITHCEKIDAEFSPFCDRKITELNPVELAILRLGTVELIYHLEVPYRVVINEAVELAKEFGATDAHKYINGVLDQVARKVRKLELK